MNECFWVRASSTFLVMGIGCVFTNNKLISISLFVLTLNLNIHCFYKWFHVKLRKNCYYVPFYFFCHTSHLSNVCVCLFPSICTNIMNELLVYSWAGAPQDWWQAVATAAAAAATVTAPISEPNSNPGMGQSGFAGLTTAGNLTNCLSPAASALTNLVVGLDGSLLAADFLPFTSTIGDKSKHTIIN